MAVHTALTQKEIADFVNRYDIGALRTAQGITEGIENTNYLLETDAAKYILTVFEQRTRAEDLPYFVHLMQHFSQAGIACPQPVARADGGVLAALKEKPAMITSFLEGSGVAAIRLEHMPQLGTLLAKMHLAGMDFPHRRENAMSLAAWESLAVEVAGRADDIEEGLAGLIRDELFFLRENWPSGLPEGPIHADLFPDNVFFVRERGGWQLSGVIDFYFACHDMWAYDVAVCINAWCFDDRGKLVQERLQALLAAYNDVRPMNDEEGAAMPILLRGAALRFLLTRTYDWLHTPEGSQVVKKDPLEYVARLCFFQEQPV